MTAKSMTRGLMTRRTFWIALLLVWSLGPMLWQLVSSFTTSDMQADLAQEQANYTRAFMSDHKVMAK